MLFRSENVFSVFLQIKTHFALTNARSFDRPYVFARHYRVRDDVLVQLRVYRVVARTVRLHLRDVHGCLRVPFLDNLLTSLRIPIFVLKKRFLVHYV